MRLEAAPAPRDAEADDACGEDDPVHQVLDEPALDIRPEAIGVLRVVADRAAERGGQEQCPERGLADGDAPLAADALERRQHAVADQAADGPADGIAARLADDVHGIHGRVLLSELSLYESLPCS